LIATWDQRNVLQRYKHHFSFTITGPEHSILEPGLHATLAERYAQLARLCEIARDGCGQDPNSSIMVHLDPIVAYQLPCGAGGVEKAFDDNLGHVRDLFAAMHALGLTRVHMSFMQYDWAGLCKRIREAAEHINFVHLDSSQQEELLRAKVLPHAAEFGIKLQTCTAMDMVAAGHVSQGACVGWEDVYSITQGQVGERAVQKPKTGSDSTSTRGCTCYPHQDVGDKFLVRCTHGCRYCFVRPQEYDW
jgi:hypothetical protein